VEEAGVDDFFRVEDVTFEFVGQKSLLESLDVFLDDVIAFGAVARQLLLERPLE
jgi:hypothetical protein